MQFISFCGVGIERHTFITEKQLLLKSPLRLKNRNSTYKYQMQTIKIFYWSDIFL
jgi:hypothetical protein